MMCTSKRWRVLLLDTKSSNPNHYICLAIEKALASDPRIEFVCKTTLGNAIDSAKKNNCDLFFAFDGEELHTDICIRLRSICNHAILWVTEDPYELPLNLRNADLFDLIFTNDSASVSAYSGRAIHLPFAGSRWLHEQQVRKAEDCRYDVLFVGTAWPNRVDLLRSLIDGVSNLKTKIALPTNPYLPPVNLNISNSAINWRVSNSDFVRLANTSKVVLTLHRDFTTSNDARSTAATPGPRLFELAFAGTCQLVDGSLQEVTQYFDSRQEIAIFNGAAQALETLRELLNNPRKRDDMALAAQKRAIRDHTYSHRISVILDQLEILKHENQNLVNMPERPRVLLLAHNVIGEGAWGGVEVYIDWIRRTLADQYEVWTYVPRHGTNGRSTILRNDHDAVIETFNFSDAIHDSVLTCSERELVFSKILQKYEFRALHVHHLIGHPPSLPLIARSLGIATMISLHDYYAICHHFTLVGDTGRYCEIEQRNEADCDFCLGATMGTKPGAIARRRGWWRRVLGSFDILHANTLGLRERFENVYGNLSKHSGWSVMGIPIDKVPEAEVPSQNGPLRVAVPGNFTRFKGAHTLITVLRQLQGEQLEVTLLGRVDEEFKHVLSDEGLDYVRCEGNYMPAELHEKLIGHHVSLHVSMWPETWCLTLSEAWRAGLIPIVTDIGALSERVSDGKTGFLIPTDRPSRLVNKLRDLARNRSILIEMQKNISESDILYSSEHSGWLRRHYRNMVDKTIYSKNNSIQGLTAFQAGYFCESPSWYDISKPVSYIPIISGGIKSKQVFLIKFVKYFKKNGVKATVLKARSVLKAKFL